MFVPADPPSAASTSTPEPGELSIDGLDREIRALNSHISAAMCRWLVLVGELEHRRGHEQWGFASCADWLAWRCGISDRAARERVRVARRLRELPLVTAAFSSGTLSYSKVRVLTRLRSIEREAELVDLALHATAAQLERMVRAHAQAAAGDDPQLQAENRFVSWRWDIDGSLELKARLSPEDGVTLLRALEQARDELRLRSEHEEHGVAEPKPDGPAGPLTPEEGACEAGGSIGPQALNPEAAQPAEDGVPGDSARAGNAEALALIAESVLSSGATSRDGGERCQLVVHVEARSLTWPGEESSAPDASRVAEIERGPAIPAEAARRLGCDAAIVSLIERDGAPLAIGRKSRSVPAPMRRALIARDRGCRFPGCTRDRFVDAHHIHHWAHGGKTELSNLVLLCRAHHRLVHEGGFALERLDDGGLVFRRPDGAQLPRVPTPVGGDGAFIEAENEKLGIEIGPETGRSLSSGEPMDLSLAVDALLAYAPP